MAGQCKHYTVNGIRRIQNTQ